jgi:hypothetical protein
VKVLFLMDSPEYLRFYDSAIEEMAARGHSVAIAVNHQNAKKPVGLDGLKAYADRVTVLGLVPERQGFWSGTGRAVRALMDFVRFLHPDFAAAPALRARIKRKVLPRAWHWLDSFRGLSAATVQRVEGWLRIAERAIPVYPPIVECLREQAPDVLLVSPLVTAASPQVEWIKAAHVAGTRTAVCVASWDNLTNKGLLRIEPDLVMVWNEAQRREAQAYHDIPAAKIALTGAQLFDKWFERTVTRPRAEFCARVGFPDTAPFVLFTGSSSFISESNAEVAFVRRWIAALRASGDPLLSTINILVRPHPYNFHTWASEPVADLPGVRVYPRQGYNPIDAGNRDDFFDSLFHAAAVVGINTSAMIEAAIVGRPVCSLLAEEFAGTQEGTIHFHHLLPEHGGFLRIAATIDEHVRQLADCLQHPETTRAETERFVGSFIRPHGAGRRATPIFVDTVETLAAQPAPAPRAEAAWLLAVRPFVVVAAALTLMVDSAANPDASSRLRKQVASYRKRLAGVPKRARKQLSTWGKRWKRFRKEVL